MAVTAISLVAEALRGHEGGMTHWFALPMTACVALAATLAACGDGSVRVSSTRTETTEGKGPLKVVSTLQCPQKLGVLTRKGSAFAGGSVCSYVGQRGAEVSLHLVALDGAPPREALQAFEDRLSAAMPQAASQIRANTQTATTAASAATATASASAASEPGMSIDANGDKARIRLPGLRIDADGEKASVNIGGLRIRADDSTGAVSVNGGEGDEQVSVNANQDAVQVRTSTSGDATRATWILTDERADPDSWRFVGYDARGPVGGPLVVATVRSKDEDGGRTFDDAKKLVILNVGQ